MNSKDQEPAKPRKKRRGYEIASYILMGGGAINLVTGLALLLFTGRLFSQISQLEWYTIVLLSQSVAGIITMFVGIGLYLHSQG